MFIVVEIFFFDELIIGMIRDLDMYFFDNFIEIISNIF